MNLLNRWIKSWSKAKDWAAAKYADQMFRDHHLPAPPDDDDEPVAPRWLIQATTTFEFFAERMEAIGHVIQQRTPVDANSHRHSLEEVGRVVYTAKAVIALLLNRHAEVGNVLDWDPVCAALYNEQHYGGENPGSNWDEVIVPPGLSNWSFEIRRDSDS